MEPYITINTDGSCLGNPGPGGFGAIIDIDDDISITVTGGDPSTTNSRMELSAVVEALRVVNNMDQLKERSITIRSDSKYVVDAFNDRWIDNWFRNGWRTAKRQPVANQDLWQDLLDAAGDRRIVWQWVKGHSGDPMNERCDQLATAEAAFAPHTAGYWVSAGNPRSTVEGTNTAPPGAPTTAPLERRAPAGTEALRIMEAMKAALEQCATFDEFRSRMLGVMTQAEW